MKINLSVLLSFFLLAATTFGQQAAKLKEDCHFFAAKDFSDASAPRFSAYPARHSETAKEPKLDLKSNPFARRYHTALRGEIAKGPNFAGHYRVGSFGCGSSCALFAVVNLATGKVITPEGFESTSLVHFETDGFLPNANHDSTALRFKKNSRLLVIIGALDEDESKEGIYYFALQGERLVQVHRTVLKTNCPNG